MSNVIPVSSNISLERSRKIIFPHIQLCKDQKQSLLPFSNVFNEHWMAELYFEQRFCKKKKRKKENLMEEDAANIKQWRGKTRRLPFSPSHGFSVFATKREEACTHAQVNARDESGRVRVTYFPISLVCQRHQRV